MKVVHFIIRYIENWLIWIDQGFNTLMFGDPDETVSSWLGRRCPECWITRVVDTIFFWDKNHTRNAIEEVEGRRDLL